MARIIEPAPFPLWRHEGTGQWCKKIRGRFHYFGLDRKQAAEKYYREIDDILAGRVPKEKDHAAVTVGRVCNDFLNWKRDRVASGELTAGMWDSYHAVCGRMIDTLGAGRSVADLSPSDFGKLRAVAAGRLGVYALKREITLCKAVFAFAYSHELIPAPVRYGSAFDKPKRKDLVLARRAKGKKLVSAADLRRMIDAADAPFRAMLYLGINCGYGGSDCARLTRSMLAADPGWIDAPREKTGADRRCPLWPETVAALEAARDVRPDPKDPAEEDLAFVTRNGNPWVRYNDRDDGKPGSRVDTVAANFRRLADKLGVAVPGGFYTLRHTFRTVADAVRDTPAVRLVMGHTENSIDDHYRETIDDSRLLAVVNHVRDWLFSARGESR